MGAFESLLHLLQDPKAIQEDLKEAEQATKGPQLELHSARADDECGSKAVLDLADKRVDEKTASRPELVLAGLDKRKLVKSYDDASAAKRDEMLRGQAGLQLFSIILERYRPGPAFRVGHVYDDGLLEALTEPGGESWAKVLGAKRSEITKWGHHAVRLEDEKTRQKGSGTLLADGRILTAGHVITDPGWLFGKPPSQSAKGRAGMNCVVDGQNLGMEVTGYQESLAKLDCAWIHTGKKPGEITAADSAVLTGLPLRKEAYTAKQLERRRVVLVGHPGPPSPEECPLAKVAYKDAPLLRGYKRFMPGLLIPEKPLIQVNGLDFLRHDCSSLAGTSGGCLIDLETGEVLGVHVSGIQDGIEDRNRALAAWCIA